MPLTRRKRIILELLGPPLLGALPFVLVLLGTDLYDAVVKNGTSELAFAHLQMAAMVLMFAYIFVGIQSILYVLIMEWRFSRGLDPRSWRSVRLSSFLGFASGAVVALPYLFGPKDVPTVYLYLVWGILGLFVGFCLGLLIKIWSEEKTKTEEKLP